MGDRSYKTWHFYPVEGNSLQFVPVYPGADSYTERPITPNRTWALLTGDLFSSVLGDHLSYETTFPITHVTSADRHFIHKWWRAQTRLVLVYNKDEADPTQTTVRIINGTPPLPIRHPTRPDLWQGSILLRDRTGEGKVDGSPLILDDPVYGILDANNRVL